MKWVDAVDRPTRTYENESIAVDWYPERCIHARFCVRGLPDVFDPRRRPWIEPGGQTGDALAQVIRAVPRFR